MYYVTTPADGLMSGTTTWVLCRSFMWGENEDDEGDRGKPVDSFTPFLADAEEPDVSLLSITVGFGSEFSGGK